MPESQIGQPKIGVTTFFYAAIWGFTAALEAAVLLNSLIPIAIALVVILVLALTLRVNFAGFSDLLPFFMLYIIIPGITTWATNSNTWLFALSILLCTVLVSIIHAYQVKRAPIVAAAKAHPLSVKGLKSMARTPEQSWRDWARQSVQGPISQQLAATAAALRALEMRQNRIQALAAAQQAAHAWAPSGATIDLRDPAALEKHWRDWAAAKFGGPQSRILATAAAALRVLERNETEEKAVEAAEKTAKAWAQPARVPS